MNPPGPLATIGRGDVLRLLASDASTALVEALGAPYYDDAHLPGAVNIPPQHVTAVAPRLLPHRDTPVVVYCSRSCTSADDTAARLRALGYRQVFVYRGGKEDWVEAGLPLERSGTEGTTSRTGHREDR